MKNHSALLFLLLMGISGFVFSATNYPTLQDAYNACNAKKAEFVGSPQFQTFTCIYPAPNNSYGTQGYGLCNPVQTGSCWDYYYSTTPVNCISPQVKSTSTGLCQTPPTCTAPAVYDNPSNSCVIPACPSGQTRLPAPDNSCVPNASCPSVLPLCSTPAYVCNNGDGTQKTVPACSQTCGNGFHAVGNSCVADNSPPISCPPGFTINSNNSCESAPPIVCPSGTRAGTVNGDHVCVGVSSDAPINEVGVTPSQNTGTGTGSETSTTTTRDSSGNVTGTSTTTTTTNNNFTLDTTGLASEGTNRAIRDNTQGIKDTLKGMSDKLNQTDNFSSGTNTHGDGKTAGKSAITSALCQGNNCSVSPNCSTGSCSPSERLAQFQNLYSLDVTASGECQSINIDLSGQGYGDHSASPHCDLMESVRTPVSVTMSILIVIGFFTILMSA